MEIIWGKKSLPYVSLTWSGTDQQASREISFTLPWNPYDSSLTKYNIKKGDVVELREGSSVLFVGTITTREKTDEIGTSSYTAKDFLHHLLRSNGTYIFKGKTPEQITKKVASDAGVSTGSLFKTGVVIPKLIFESQCFYDIIIKAYRKVKSYTGKNYMPIMNGTKLTIIEKGNNCGAKLTQGVNITSAKFTDTVDNMVDIVRIYNDKHKEVGTAKNDDNLKKYGVYQESYQKEKGTSATKAAKAMLYGVTREASVDALGDLRAISGYAITIEDPATGLDGKFYITSDTHTFENNVHTMSLDLAWKDGMEAGAETYKKPKETKVQTGSVSVGGGGSYTAYTGQLAEAYTQQAKEQTQNYVASYIVGKTTGYAGSYSQEHTYYHSSTACRILKNEIKKNGNNAIKSGYVKDVKKMKRQVAPGKYEKAHKQCPICWTQGKYGQLAVVEVSKIR